MDGHQFVAPKQYSSGYFRRKSDGTITDYTSYPRPQPDPPILSNEALSDPGDENRVSRGYGNWATRGTFPTFTAALSTRSIDHTLVSL
jgi:hypothetical protein